jgi:hypothetical protein
MLIDTLSLSLFLIFLYVNHYFIYNSDKKFNLSCANRTNEMKRPLRFHGLANSMFPQRFRR